MYTASSIAIVGFTRNNTAPVRSRNLKMGLLLEGLQHTDVDSTFTKSQQAPIIHLFRNMNRCGDTNYGTIYSLHSYNSPSRSLVRIRKDQEEWLARIGAPA